MNKINLCTAMGAAVLLGLGTAVSYGETLFLDDFESGNLDKWVGKSGAKAESYAKIIDDPVEGGSHGKVVCFTSTQIEGAIYTKQLFNHTELKDKEPLMLQFDYVGLTDKGGNEGNLGGYIGYSKSSAPGSGTSNHRWVGGTGTSPYTDPKMYVELTDDGNWKTYTVNFSVLDGGYTHNHFVLMLEDYRESGGVAGDACFDNIMLTDNNGPDEKINEDTKKETNEETKTEDCQCAVYTLSDRSLSVPAVKVPMFNTLTGLPTGDVKHYTGRMKQFDLYSTGDGTEHGFKVQCDTLRELDDSDITDQCVGTLDKGTLKLPCVEVPILSGLCYQGRYRSGCNESEEFEAELEQLITPTNCCGDDCGGSCGCGSSDGGISFKVKDIRKKEIETKPDETT